MQNKCISLDKINEVQVFVVSSSPLQSELIAKYLESKTGATCSYWSHKKPLTINEKHDEEKCLILLDCSNMNTDSIKEYYGSRLANIHSNGSFALFNVQSGSRIEVEAFDMGIQGIFYENDTPEMLAKGIMAILSGELWFSRGVLAKNLLNRSRYKYVKKDPRASLTSREKEILIMIASGIANKGLAEQLNISPNTVKTHITNIYQKIDVPNRIQATLWAVHNLSQ